MHRTNIYLDDRQLASLRAVSDSRGEPVAAIVREAIDAWLDANGVTPIEADEWQQRFDRLVARRSKVARRLKPAPSQVEQDVAAAVTEARASRRR